MSSAPTRDSRRASSRSTASWSAFGRADRQAVARALASRAPGKLGWRQTQPYAEEAVVLTKDEQSVAGAEQLRLYRRATNYIAAAMIYLQDNVLVEEPLRPEHIKHRLLGHWGTVPGLNL